MSKQTNLAIYRGDDKTWNLAFKDAEGDPIDITGATVWFTAKENTTDEDASAVLQKQITSHSNPTQGETQLSLIPSDTDAMEVKDYEYDMQLVESSGKVSTFMRGKLNIIQDITVST